MDNGHLSEADLEIIWNSKTSRSEGQAEQKLLAHCKECASCAEMLSDYEDVHREMDSLKDLSSTDETSCPNVDLWIKLAAGLVDQEQAMQMLKHACACRQCTQQLTRAQAYVAEDPEPVAGLESVTAKWQRAVARLMAAHPPVVKEQKANRFRLFWIAATAAVVAAFAVSIVSITRPRDADQLLAQAYGQNRTLEVRFSGARYGPVRTERGSNGQSILNQSPALLEALPLISRHLEKEPNNPAWLDAKGRADLLGRNYSSAIQSFEKGLEAEPDSPLLLTDAASAYFERGQIADRPGDYGKAIELLSKALRKNPDDPIALYNRALVSEKMFLYHQAADDWTHYLQVAPKDEWADEAASHLKAVRQKLTDQQKRAVDPLVDPETIVRQASNRDEQVINTLGARSEEYLDQAIRKWLPIAFPTVTAPLERNHVHGNSPQKTSFNRDHWSAFESPAVQKKTGPQIPSALPSERLALQVLADVLSKKHDDEWLSDLLRVPPSAVVTRAIHALAEAADANATGGFDLARHKAEESIRLFERGGNLAGESRARFEIVYALERTELGQRCLEAAFPLANHLSTHRYSWIHVQLDVEQANCWAQIGQFSKAATYLKEALARAEKSGYGTLYLRSLGMAASLLTSEGNSAAAYAINLRGLAHYWSGSYPPLRAHQFYSDIWFPVHKAGEWSFAFALEKEAVSAIALTEQRLGEAVARQRLANAAGMTGDYDLATAESNRAKALYAALPPSEATRTLQAYEEIELAKLEADHGEVGRSSMHLLQARKQLPQIVNYFIALHFYQTLGELQQLKGEKKETEKAFRSAVAASEWGLASSQTERERITWAREAGDAYRSLAGIYWKSGDVEGAFRLWEWYRGAPLRGSQGGAPPRNIAEARLKSSDVDFARLESGPPLPSMEGLLREPFDLHQNTVLSYMQLSTGLVVWVFDDRGVTAKWIAAAPRELSRLTRHFRDECADPKSDLAALRQDARQLYDLLIGPVSDRLLPERILVIEPDDAIAELPVSALLDPAGRYLGEVYPLVFSPGLLYQRHLRRAQGFTTHQRALAIGSPALDGDLAASLGPLEDSAYEARYVASKFEKATVFTGAKASLSNVRRELPRAAVFHFAGHAIANAEELGLMLASPHSLDAQAATASLLNISNLTSIDLRKLQLAVLSACSTATGDEDEPRDPENLVRILLRAGVPHVVASRWNVNSSATAQFMRIFYDRLLQEHGSVATALQAAGVALRHGVDTAHPYYWAAFSAFGRG